jgi:putative membrane protein
MWNYGMMGGSGAWWMWALMALGTIGFWLVVAYVVRLVVQGRPVSPGTGRPTSAEALRLLDERLARGEIDAEEYLRIREALTGSR